MKNIEVLNDLILINNDRIEGYNKAAKETKEERLRSLFADMAQQSGEMLNELKEQLKLGEADAENGTTLKGKIYRAWMDIKATFGGDDRKALLASCEFGEDAAQKAYESALNEAELSIDVRNVIQKQQMDLKHSHDRIKNMRDAAQPA
ncbi:MAG: PA2169 family four-helix-bundle protein [Niastella sp.]|nr:PA2169 family four-helix-bundle protein [Niastella sp.]